MQRILKSIIQQERHTLFFFSVMQIYVAWQKQLLCEQTPAANVGEVIIIKPLDRPHHGCSASSGGAGGITQITLGITLE